MPRPPLIAVCGASQPRPVDLEAAATAGRLLAGRGWPVLCGGLGGVMGAVAEAVSASGGLVIGLLPGDDPEGGHPSLTVALPTGLGEGRNLLLVRAASAVLAIGGGLGTLSELALALRLGRPVAGVGTWDLRGPGGLRLDDLGLRRCDDAADAVGWLAHQLDRRGGT